MPQGVLLDAKANGHGGTVIVIGCHVDEQWVVCPGKRGTDSGQNSKQGQGGQQILHDFSFG